MHLHRLLSLRTETGRLREPSSVKHLDEERRVRPRQGSAARAEGPQREHASPAPGAGAAVGRPPRARVGVRATVWRDSARVSGCARASERVSGVSPRV